MSTRAKKSGPSTGQSGRPADTSPPAGSSARGRSTSPVMTSRVAEKNELASLNDRLAVYIDRVRQLEADKERLTRACCELEESVNRQSSSVKAVYDRELAEARRLLDQLAQEKAKCQLEVSKLQSQVEDLKSKYIISHCMFIFARIVQYLMVIMMVMIGYFLSFLHDVTDQN